MDPIARRLAAAERGAPITITVNGRPVPAYSGESIAAALMAAGWRSFRRNGPSGMRGVFCAMGACFDCLVTVDGRADIRSCMTAVREGCAVEVEEP